jgi:hypothetical protein
VEQIGYWVGLIVRVMPVTVTLIVGVALLLSRRDRLAPRARGLSIAGCAVGFLNVLLGSSFEIVVRRLFSAGIRYSGKSIGTATTVHGFTTTLLMCVGLGLLIAAILAAAPAPPAPSVPPFVAGPPPGYPPAAS